MVHRLGRFWGGLGVFAVAAGCGGRSLPGDETSPGESPPEATPAPPEPPSTERPNAPTPPPMPTAAPTPDPVPTPTPTPTNMPPPEPPGTANPEPVPPSVPGPAPEHCADLGLEVHAQWFSQGPSYGLQGPGMLSFSPDGQRLATTGDQYRITVMELDVATGTGSWQDLGEEVVYGRDAAWRYELRGSGSVLRAVGLASPDEAVSWDLLDPIRGAAISDDGSYLGALTCHAGTLVASRRALAGGDPHEVTLGLCESYVSDVVFSLVEHGKAALLAAGTSGGVTRVDFERSTSSDGSFHAVTYTSQSVFGIALSPDGRMGLSAGGNDVRAWTYPDLQPLFEPLAIDPTPGFSNCYVTPRYFAALSFSPDGRFLTTSGDGQKLTLRRACDLAPIAELEPDLKPLCSSQDGVPPGLATFSPTGEQLAAWWGGVVGMFRLEPTGP